MLSLKKIPLLGAFVFLWALSAQAQGLAVTDVAVTPAAVSGPVKAMVSLSLNGALKLEGVEYVQGGGKDFLKFPEYVSRSGRPYAQVRIRDPKLYQDMLEAVRAGKASGAPLSEIRFAVTDWRKTRGTSSRKANAEVTFNEALSVTVGVMEGEHGPWIAWPAQAPEKKGGRWADRVSLLDKRLEKNVEQTLLKRYSKDHEQP